MFVGAGGPNQRGQIVPTGWSRAGSSPVQGSRVETSMDRLREAGAVPHGALSSQKGKMDGRRRLLANRAPPRGSRSVVVVDGADPDVPETGRIAKVLEADGSFGGVGLVRGGRAEGGRSVPLLAVVEHATVGDHRGLGGLGQLAARVEARGRYPGDGVQAVSAELPRVDRETWGHEWSRIAGPKIHHRTSSRSPWRRGMRRSSPDRSNRTARHRGPARARGDAISSEGTAHWARGRWESKKRQMASAVLSRSSPRSRGQW